MKLHITQKAIDQVAVEYAIARATANKSSGLNHEYFLGKATAIADTFAYLMRQSFIEATMMLKKRGKLPEVS